MLTLYDSSGVPAYPLDVPTASFFITHVYGGLDTLSFDISPKHPVYVNIAEEIQVEYADILYKIKSVNERATTSTIGCVVDLDFLKKTVHFTYTSTTRSLREVLSEVLPGWALEDVDKVTIRRSIELTNCTDYDVVMQAMETYGVVYEWHNKDHRLKVIKPELIQPSGEYLTDELNLKQLAFKGSSSDLITRLYPIGKDGLTIADVNGGKIYVEYRSYCNQVISAIWSDDRYTDAQSLKNDALERLKTTAYPVRSYECSVQDLAKVDATYSHLSFELYQIVTLIDRQRGTRIDHRIMEYKEYPLQPDLNVVTLANVATKITTEIKRVETKFDGEIEVDRTIIKELREDADSMSQRISNTYTKGETDTEIASQITQATDGIRLEASKTYATKEEVEQIELTPGPQGPKGDKGDNSYFHIKYSPVANPTAAQMTETPSTYIGTYVDYTATDSTDPSKYTWARFQGLQGPQGTQGIPGTNGANGQTSYLHIKYSDDGGKTLTANAGETPGDYIGQYTDFVAADSTDPTKYTWSKIKGATGPQGPQGVQGPKGADGKQYYTWLKYADTPTSGMSDDPAGKKYMGLAYNKTTATESSNYADYTWSLIKGEKGEQGVQGPAGANGQPTYTWIKYGTSASGANMSDDPTGKTYIGLAYNKTTAAESNNASDYTWSLIKGADGVSVSSVTVEYYLSTSATAQTGGSWSTTVPTWEDGRYMWTRTKTALSNGSTTTTTPVCITGGKGGTGAAGKGVKSIATQFYLSTSKTAQTGGSWGTTMPTWTPGKYVWTRSMITYTDNTTTTTTPQCDSGWEAVDGIEVGGRNLLTNSLAPRLWYCRYGDKMTGQVGTDEVDEIVEGQQLSALYWMYNPDGCSGDFRLSNSPQYDYDANYIYAIKAGAQICCYVWVKSAASGAVKMFVTNRNDKDSTYEIFNLEADTWTKIGIAKTFTTATETPGVRVRFILSQGMKIYVALAKLEVGNKATDWTPAPEDTDDAINDAMTTVIDRTSAAIDIANDNILNTVSREYSKKSELEEVRQYTDTKVQQTADSITYTFTTVQEAIDLLDGKVDQNKLDMEEYIRFAGAMIELGKRGSPFVAKLDNTKLAFLQDGREIAYISNNTLYITDAIIKGRLTMTMVGGFFDWVPEQNGSMSLVWREA